MVELLAPAKNIEVARAAIAAGADAVYIGGPAFGARQAAGNTIEDISALTDYAHRFGVRVLVTLNTLLSPAERKEAAGMAWALYRAGVDALIVQDTGLLSEDLPPIRLHASTQCDNRTAEQVLALQQMGFRRAVLARELSIDEIRAIRKATIDANPTNPIELEVFVHGAVCVCYSGRCFMSERLMQRSANRGACAQMCRMAYDVLDAEGNLVRDDEGRPMRQRYVLSLKDMDRSAYLQELLDAGVHTLKIEGRLKDAAYVTNVVAYYRQLLDHGIRPDLSFSFTPNPEKTFHRDGSPYFLHGRTTGMANMLTPKSTGEKIGLVTSAGGYRMHLQLLPEVELHNGDGLCYGDKGFQINTVSRLQGDVVSVTTFRDEHVPVGTLLYRNTDTAFLRQLHAERRIPVSLAMDITPDGFLLRMQRVWSDGSNRREWQVERTFVYPHTPAKNEQQARSTLETQLRKLGDSEFVATTISLPAETFFVPLSVINAWRRELVEAAIRLPQDTDRDGETHVARQCDVRTEENNWPLMTCKYCLLFELGRCRKNNPQLPEPRYLRLSNNTTVELHFDCKRCEMTIHQLR